MSSSSSCRSSLKSWYLYLVRCGDGSIYTGVSNDVGRRLSEHRSGKGARYLRGRTPLTLARKIRVGSRGDALKIELRVKRLPRDKKEKLIQGQVRLKDLIRKKITVTSDKKPQ